MLTLKMPTPSAPRRCRADAPNCGPNASGAARPATLAAPTGVAWLLTEAIELAGRLGCRVVEAELDGEPTGVRWSRGRKQVWLDLGESPTERLNALADALRGEPALCGAEMSPALRAFMSPRRAA